jgi:hypothetical protein
MAYEAMFAIATWLQTVQGKRCKAASAMQSTRPSLHYFKVRALPLPFAFLACTRCCVVCVMCQHAAASDDRSQRVQWCSDLEHLELLVALSPSSQALTSAPRLPSPLAVLLLPSSVGNRMPVSLRGGGGELGNLKP